MKRLLHKLKAARLRYRLVHQRLDNIRAIRRGRCLARLLKRDFVRETRLAAIQPKGEEVKSSYSRSSFKMPSFLSLGRAKA